jgi:alginate O-acetyltransferase complex protein AlgI
MSTGGAVPATRGLLDFACYVTMFPQLVAGPIVRYRNIARQLVERSITRAGFSEGIRRFTIGLGKKVLIADTVAVPADAIFARPTSQLSVGAACLRVVCYTAQIYFDFSGYSDMAIGLGRMLGFRLLENFQYPYISLPITLFWRRWQISLSTWEHRRYRRRPFARIEGYHHWWIPQSGKPCH